MRTFNVTVTLKTGQVFKGQVKAGSYEDAYKMAEGKVFDKSLLQQGSIIVEDSAPVYSL